ncbi:hypothetical protein [Hymenobacter sp. DG25A]|uniref:hypothetical protein n=1 Tax=Hymenobacter sp. DG25A TaxID=1385663 RepID=UPI0006BC94B5|nr:hypothetical protein [Hymenobacter sp. DG25A]ALD20227.1 hypothetical protein AM218_02000 [Hymenobacter sp. DG25A]
MTLGACKGPTKEQLETAEKPSASAAQTAATEPMDTLRPLGVTAQADTLQQVQKLHEFSQVGKPDKFTLVLRGKTLLTGELTFTIASGADNRVIFRETFPVSDLEAAMVYEMKTPTATPAEREAYVRKRLQEFFADKNFVQPAIGPRDTYQPGTTLDQAAWQELHSRKDAVGFVYLLGKEDRRKIAWSPMRQQVVQVASYGG